MPHLIKKSNKRLVICNKVIKLINYEKPFFYNFPPLKRSRSIFIEKQDRRLDNTQRAKNKLKNLILSNYGVNKQMVLFVTFTFAENIVNPKQANPEWKLFILRLNYYLNSLGFQKAKYITVIEFQERGAVHYHTLFFNIPYIKNIKTEFARLWALGFVKIKAIPFNDSNHCANYVSKYMTKTFNDKFFSSSKNYFCSRNIKKPIKLRNENDIVSMLQQLDNEYILEIEHTEKYISQKYGLVEFTQLNLLN